MVTFLLEDLARQIVLDDATQLSSDAMEAVRSAATLFGHARREVTCSPEVARELRAWFHWHERVCLSLPGHEWKSSLCREAKDAIPV
jgi:hypothetical protein